MSAAAEAVPGDRREPQPGPRPAVPLGERAPWADGGGLTPPAMAAAAEAAPWGWACGRRFLWLAGSGVILWLAMLTRPIGLLLLVIWEGAAVLAWVLDAHRLPAPARLGVGRTWLGPAHLGGIRLRWSVHNGSGAGIAVTLQDDLPAAVSGGGELCPFARHWLPPGEAAREERNLHPLELGPAGCGDAYLRYQTGWGLAERWARVRLAQTARVYPDLQAARGAAVGLSRASQRQAAARRQARRAGEGREFASLRAFRPGDEPRDLCWPASARCGRLMAKERQAERGEPVWLVLDCGRLMRARVGGQRRLGHLAATALALASTALAAGDRVGLLAYGGGLQCRLPPAPGVPQERAILEGLGSLVAEPGEADHFRAAGVLLAAQPRRALVVWLTELPESGALPEVVEAGAHVSRRHFLLLAVPRPAELAAAARVVPETVAEMYRAAAALDLTTRREQTLAQLRARGARALELAPAAMAAELVRQYLEIKQAGRV